MSTVLYNNSNAVSSRVDREPVVYIVASTAARNALPNLILGDIAYVNSTTYYILQALDSTLDASWGVIAAPPAAGSANLLNGTTNSLPYQSSPSNTAFLAQIGAGTGILQQTNGSPPIWTPDAHLTTITFPDTTVVSSGSDLIKCVAVTSGSHTITLDEDYVGVNFAGTVALTLNTVTGHRTIIKDESGAANDTTHKITITPSTGTVEGQASITVTVPWMSLTLVCHSGNWFVV